MPQPQQLPGPNADIWNWQLQGLCRGVDSSMFFHPDGERGRARMQREQRAKEMCRRCPVGMGRQIVELRGSLMRVL